MLVLGVFLVMYIAKTKQAQCKPVRKEKPLLPLATPFNPLNFFFKQKNEDVESSVPVKYSFPEVYELQAMTRSRRKGILGSQDKEILSQ